LNDYTPDLDEPISVDLLYSIQAWRTNRMELLRNIIEIKDSNIKRMVMIGHLNEETFERYQIEEEALAWSFKNL
jgi:predicted metal-dependent TIM-barrel fold hydrolase